MSSISPAAAANAAPAAAVAAAAAAVQASYERCVQAISVSLSS